MVLNTQWASEEIKGEFFKTWRTMKLETPQFKIFGAQTKAVERGEFKVM